MKPMSGEGSSNIIDGELLEILEDESLLVHAITNYVTVADVAEVIRLWGALPVMAHSPQESGEMASSAEALVLNTGTIDENSCSGMVRAAESAAAEGIPVVLDPVGVGATSYRTDFVQELLQTHPPDIIKGNAGEISTLAGRKARVRGVESQGEHQKLEKSALYLAEKYSCAVLVTGSMDLAADEDYICRLEAGTPLLGRIVGTGCMLAGTLGAMAAAQEIRVEREKNRQRENLNLRTAVTGAAAFAAAADLAAAEESSPASFRRALLDRIYKCEPAEIKNLSEVTIISGP